jgi:hypothetical protein
MFWLHRSPDEVLDIFATLPGAITVGERTLRSVYVPGSREDRVLLVSHVDTVFDSKPVPVMPVYKSGVISSGVKTAGIGADDRAGCAILWRLRYLGHSLLLTNSEETGCQGSRFIERDTKLIDELNTKHKFAVEFDRRGSSDLVFYSVGSPEFIKWCEANFDGYKHNWGSFTDIGVLCKTMCGVNISVGYYDEHGSSERLVLKEWHRTLETARKALSQLNIPRFEQPKRTYTTTTYRGYYDIEDPDLYDEDRWRERYEMVDPKTAAYIGYKNTTPAVAVAEPEIDVDTSCLTMCPWCSHIQCTQEAEANQNQCVFCFREL